DRLASRQVRERIVWRDQLFIQRLPAVLCREGDERALLLKTPEHLPPRDAVQVSGERAARRVEAFCFTQECEEDLLRHVLSHGRRAGHLPREAIERRLPAPVKLRERMLITCARLLPQ